VIQISQIVLEVVGTCGRWHGVCRPLRLSLGQGLHNVRVASIGTNFVWRSNAMSVAVDSPELDPAPAEFVAD
jgi:hypothetical protein